jgi:hypothetical protein
MKLVFSFILSVMVYAAFGQQNSASQEQAQRHRAMVSDKVSAALLIPREKAGSVLSLIATSGTKMREIMKSATLTKEEKLNRCRQLAGERDARIAALLTNEQVKKLQAVIAANSPKPPPGKNTAQ